MFLGCFISWLSDLGVLVDDASGSSQETLAQS